jgi:hypothetical protein
MTRPEKLLAAAGFLLAASLGCTQTIEVDHYPSFYEPSLEKVAVLAFRNDSLRPRAGMFLSTRLAAALRGNGTYRVIGPKQAAARLAEKGVELPADMDPQRALEAVRDLGEADAFVLGSVNAFSADRHTYTDVDYVYLHGGYGGYHPWHYGYGARYGRRVPVYRSYDYTTARAVGSASLIRVADGEVLAVVPFSSGIEGAAAHGGSLGLEEAMTRSAEIAVRRMLEGFAVVPMEIEVDPGKALRTARPGEDGRPEYTSTFRSGQGRLLAVVDLPREADRNEFRLGILAEDRERPLLEERFTWSAGEGPREVSFDLGELIERAGPGEYELVLYSRGKPALRREFEVEGR